MSAPSLQDLLADVASRRDQIAANAAQGLIIPDYLIDHDIVTQEVQNISQFGPTDSTINSYKEAAEYAAESQEWAEWSESKKKEVQDILNNAGDAGTLVALAQSTGATKIGYKFDILPSTNTVASKLSETVSVVDFGAVGDGVTDDTEAFKSAYESDAVTIKIPSNGKIFKISSPIGSTTIAKKKIWVGDHGSEVILVGSGGFQVTGLGWGFDGIRFTPGQAGVPFAIQSGTLQSNRFSHINNCEFRGKTAGHYFNVCIDLYNVWYSNFNGNYINQSGGVDFSTGEIHGIGLRMSYCVNNSVRDNRIGSCEINLQLTSTPAPLGMMSSQFCCEGIVITGNTLIASSRSLDVREGYYIDVHDNVIDIPNQATIHPVYFACMCSRLSSNWISTMYGSVYVGKGESGLGSYDGTANSIDNNVIRASSSATQPMIEVGAIGLLSIKGNQITFGSVAISGVGGGNWNISDNIFSAQTVQVYDLDSVNRILYSNNKVYTTLPKPLKTISDNSYVSPTVWSNQVSVPMADRPLTSAGVVTPAQTIYIALPPNRFTGAPESATATLATDHTLGIARYNKGLSSSTAIVFDYIGIGSPVTAGNYNFIATAIDTQSAF